MKRTTAFLALVTVIALLVAVSGCFNKKEKVMELVLTAETSVTFDEDSASESFTDSDTIDVSAVLNDALASANIDPDSIISASILGAAYGSTSLTVQPGGPQDWDIEGTIDVARIGGGSATLINYNPPTGPVSVKNSLGQEIPVLLQSAGVDVLQQGLDDFLAGDNNVQMVYTIINGNVTPNPSVQYPIVFSWKVWVYIQVTVPESYELWDLWAGDSPTSP